MKKTKLFAASVAAMALVGCTSEDYVGVVDNPTGDGIGFGSGVTATTRANSTGSQAAEKLNNNFIVYGFKTNTDESEDQVVFDRYNVNYEAGTANTTESNTADWEYVGLANHDGSINPQTIKYWDFSKDKYVFSAVSGTGITATKITTGSVYEKGWDIVLPAGGSLADLYASDRKEVLPGDYKKQVDLTFRALTAKIRFAMFETVPGYEVHIDKFYYNESSTATASWKNTKTNFAIDGTFKTAKKDDVTPLKITYYETPDAIKNQPKVTFDDDKVTTSVYGEFGANIQATTAIGTTSAEATYDQSDKSYTMILPYEGASNDLELYVDYTLKSTDGSGETIKVWHASAKVPSNFAQWKPNFAYTYIFKISDNSNGTTVTPGTDPSDSFTEDDPTTQPDLEKIGLFPITFDAVVITDETDVQETITSVSDPSITTYQKGVVATANDEYVAGEDIYFENGAADVTGYKVYEVNNYGSIENITEEVVANYIKNFCVLTEVEVTYAPGDGDNAADFIPLSDGTYIQKKANQAAKFTPVAGKTYVICDEATPTKHYKVVKVQGTASNRDYTLTQATNGSDVIAEWTDPTAHSVHYQLLSDNTATDKGAFGAKSLIKVYDSSNNDVTANFDIEVTAIASIYSIKPNKAALAAGKIANGDYTVKAVSDKDGSVIATGSATFNINYAVAANTVTIVAGKNADITPTIGGATITEATITGVPDGITIKETATAGTYNVAVAPTVAGGDYDINFGGKTVTITVESYAFVDSRTFTLNYEGNADQQTLFLTKNVTEYADVEVSAMSGINTSVAQIIKASAGIYAVVPMGPGSYTVTYENASAVITVNQYTLTPAAASIAKSTGSTTLTLKKNNGETKTVNASTNNVTVYKGSVSADDSNKVTTGFSLTTNGQTMKFGNVAEADTYIFHYTEDGKVVATATVTVTE